MRDWHSFAMNSQKVASYNLALKMAIVASGLTQRRIARTARIDETRFSRIVRGQVQPFPREQQRLARVLGVDASELFRQSDEAVA